MVFCVCLHLSSRILEYVQIKPILAIATVFLKIYGKYEDGHLHLKNGYTWIAIVYNFSVFVALYALTVFWICLHTELAPFRVAPKFLCVKGVIFFSFWQSLLISIIVSTGLIRHIGGIYGDTYMSTALQDFLICLEMPLFALAHMYAFSHLDYIPRTSGLVGRMPFLFALRDSFGTGDVVADTLATVHGTNYTYRSWEPSEDVRHHLYAFKGRSRAGLRYTDDGRTKYWINGNATAHGNEGTPLRIASQSHYLSTNNECDELADVHFPKLTQEEEILYQLSRKLPFGDYRYPCIQA